MRIQVVVMKGVRDWWGWVGWLFYIQALKGLREEPIIFCELVEE